MFANNSLREKCPKNGVFSGPNTGKYGPEKTPYLDTFHAVIITIFYQIIHCHCCSIVYFYIIYFTFTINKWSTIFKHNTFFSSACLCAASSPATVIVILPLTSMYASL